MLKNQNEKVWTGFIWLMRGAHLGWGRCCGCPGSTVRTAAKWIF